MTRANDTYNFLHIYGQYAPHCFATIRGTRQGLEALRDAIEDAIESGSGTASVIPSDGESYRVEIYRVGTLGALGSPEYIEDSAYEISKRRAKEYRLK